MRPVHLVVTAFIIMVLAWAWLKWVHDPRVRDEVLAEVRIDSIMEHTDSVLGEVAARDSQIVLLEALSASLSDSLVRESQRSDSLEIVTQGRTEATDALLRDSTATLGEIRLAFWREREAWEEQLNSWRTRALAAERLFQNAQQQVLLLQASKLDLQNELTSMTANWEDAESRYSRARNPGLFRRLEISTPFALAGALVGFVLGVVASQ